MSSAINMSVAALYFDGKTSRRHHVTLDVHDGVANISGEAQRQCPLAQLRVSERFKRSARKVTFPDGAYLEIVDGAAFLALLGATHHRDTLVARAQQNWRATLGAMAGLVLLLCLFYVYLLPAAVGLIAATLPPAVERKIGAGTLEFLDHRIMAPSELPPARQRAIVARFTQLATPLPDAPPVQILFRKSKIGPNALALPSGQIVLTDEFVKLLDDDDALMGVLAHELGHVHRHHLMRRLLQSSAAAAVATVLVGDVSGLLANIPTILLDSKYSRDFEREADDYAIALFQANGIPRQKLALVFERLEQHSKTENGTLDVPPYLASHPTNDERIRHILAAP